MSAKTVTAALAQVGVPRRTFYNWMGQPAFVEGLRSAQRESVQHVARRLADAGTKAIDTLVDMADKADKPAQRISAANAILSNLATLHDMAQVDVEIAELKRAVEELKRGTSKSRQTTPGR